MANFFAELKDRHLDGVVGRLFEIESRDRLLPMEGLRGIAVGLVFLQHYCVQFLTGGGLSGPTETFAKVFRHLGNYGVELFFVLSGFLIYGIILRKRPGFVPFMVRRAQRLYPAFIVALVIAMVADLMKIDPDIPAGFFAGAAYIGAQLAFLPGLFPIEPLFMVNWSLSYEWWFYIGCVVLFSVFDLGKARQQYRVLGIGAVALCLVVFSAVGIPGIPIRGLSFISGILLVEASTAHWRPVPAPLALAAGLVTFAICAGIALPEWGTAIILSTGFYAVCSSAFHGQHFLARGLSCTSLRTLGNVSYSFYLVHGFAVVAAVQLLLPFLPRTDENVLFWLCLAPIFAAAFCVGAMLYLAVEKPFSLRPAVPRTVSSSAATYT
jgi:exopolysaccharide production protein ExoZ